MTEIIKPKKTIKGVYLTPDQIKKVEKIRATYADQIKVDLSFSDTIAKMIEDHE